MKCPKCGEEIKFYDLKPNCKHCGVNVMYFTQEEGLVRDAKRSELEFASARIFGAKLMAAFISGPLQIIRLITSVLCLASLVIPVIKYSVSFPLINLDFSIGGLGIYSMISDGLIGQFGNMLNSTLLSDLSVKIIISLCLFVVTVLGIVVMIIISLLSFINIKKLSKTAAIICFIVSGYSLITLFINLFLKSSITDLSFISASLGFGSVLTAVMLIINGIINILLSKKEIVLKVRENDFERKEILKSVKKGEINLDDLTLPVFETEEEKEKRLNALKEALEKEEEGKE